MDENDVHASALINNEAEDKNKFFVLKFIKLDIMSPEDL